ncbi:MAG: NAD(P)-dependent alcohol dehydrogenase [Spirochaetales bacterium]|nr:NAD(P)-dependent alcohol dehydrogenase [Spirochaetales bacterium]
MKAVTMRRYGPPEVLEISERNVPTPGAAEVLIKVEASSINAADRRIMRADPWLLRPMFGWRRPRFAALGADVAGVVEAVGSGVTEFAPGDAVFGDLSGSGMGAYAEYAVAPAGVLARRPDSMSAAEAATVPLPAVTALQGLRDHARLRSGDRVLVVGASGAVGMFAVQIARHFGARVTAVCRTTKMEMVARLGAERVLDYTVDDVTAGPDRYDIVFDCGSYRSIFDYARILTPQGTYVHVGGSTRRLFQTMTLGAAASRKGGRRYRSFVAKQSATDLAAIREMIDADAVQTAIDGTYPLSEIRSAMARSESGEACGKVVIRVAE